MGVPNCDMKRHLIYLATLILLTQISTVAAVKPVYFDTYTGTALSVEMSRDRPGGDYHSFTMDWGSELQCQDACIRDTRCRAWTYVNPGIQGPKGRCWLKSIQPAAVRNDCCISGVK